MEKSPGGGNSAVFGARKICEDSKKGSVQSFDRMVETYSALQSSPLFNHLGFKHTLNEVNHISTNTSKLGQDLYTKPKTPSSPLMYDNHLPSPRNMEISKASSATTDQSTGLLQRTGQPTSNVRSPKSDQSAIRTRWTHRTAPHPTAPYRTAPHRTAPHRTAPHRAALHRTAPHGVTQTKTPTKAQRTDRTPNIRSKKQPSRHEHAIDTLHRTATHGKGHESKTKTQSASTRPPLTGHQPVRTRVHPRVPPRPPTHIRVHSPVTAALGHDPNDQAEYPVPGGYSSGLSMLPVHRRQATGRYRHLSLIHI